MASIERTAYPRFKLTFSSKELQQVYAPTPQEIAFGFATTQGQIHYFNLMVLLKAFQRLGYFPKLEDIPVAVVNHIRTCLRLPKETVLGYDHPRTMYRHHQAIREYLRVIPYNQQARHIAVAIVHESAQVMDNPADLINVAIAELINQGYELPGFSTLERLVRRVRSLVNRKFFGLVLNRLPDQYVQRLDEFLEIHPVHRRSPYNDLKQLPKRPTRDHLNELLAHFRWLVSLGEVEPYLDRIPATKVQHFAALAKTLDAGELKDIAQPKRSTLLLCLIHSAQVQTRDHLAEMFLKRMRTIHNRGKEELEKLRRQNQLDFIHSVSRKGSKIRTVMLNEF